MTKFGKLFIAHKFSKVPYQHFWVEEHLGIILFFLYFSFFASELGKEVQKTQKKEIFFQQNLRSIVMLVKIYNNFSQLDRFFGSALSKPLTHAFKGINKSYSICKYLKKICNCNVVNFQ